MSKTMKTTLGVSVFLLTLAIAAIAFAHGPYGGGRMMGYGGGGNGGGYGCDYGGRGFGAGADLSDETRTQIDEARESFYNETRELRDNIEDARGALRDEMASESPDEAKVVELQKRLSGLQAEFDEKAVSHRLAMRKLLPEDSRGRGYGRGYGRGKGRGFGGCGGGGGGGGRGQVNCWN